MEWTKLWLCRRHLSIHSPLICLLKMSWRSKQRKKEGTERLQFKQFIYFTDAFGRVSFREKVMPLLGQYFEHKVCWFSWWQSDVGLWVNIGGTNLSFCPNYGQIFYAIAENTYRFISTCAIVFCWKITKFPLWDSVCDSDGRAVASNTGGLQQCDQ